MKNRKDVGDEEILENNAFRFNLREKPEKKTRALTFISEHSQNELKRPSVSFLVD